ncbi:hypothetical protein GCM10009809_35650 [Isoptericola hypogeus]|uniref:Uncharacterized protein n=1 Tax=Isoptericola hypogeus TaxID=300179 RepID=A0ABP4VW08_9MICO
MPASGSTEPEPTGPGGPTVPNDDRYSRDGVAAPGIAAPGVAAPDVAQPAAHAPSGELARDPEAADVVPEGWFPA